MMEGNNPENNNSIYENSRSQHQRRHLPHPVPEKAAAQPFSL
jgi:hypothetical protein